MTAEKGKIVTVLGPIKPQKAGITLPHEHIFIWLSPEQLECTVKKSASKRSLADKKVSIELLGKIKRDPGVVYDNLILDDLELAIEEVNKFKRAGGVTIVDLTLKDIGRDPIALAATARETNINIVMGCGYYVHSTHPSDMNEKSIESITEEIKNDILKGVGFEGIRAGIIGEIGTSDPILPNEKKILRAAARAQQVTGAAISIHVWPWGRTTHDVLDILEREGANLKRVVICHQDHKVPLSDQIDYHKEILARGAYCEYDGWGIECDFEGINEGIPSDYDRVMAVKELINSGYINKILLSHDIIWKISLTKYGGYGYSHLITNGITLFKRAGIEDRDIKTLLIENPKNMLILQ
jgi:phosphotriesterase-related protein